MGDLGEKLVVQTCSCPKCKRKRTLRPLPANFRCADVICDFCGYLGQVKAATVSDVDVPPKTILGAAWKPQFERMQRESTSPCSSCSSTGGKERSTTFLLICRTHLSSNHAPL